MSLKYKTKAIVFAKNDLNESDRNFSVFTDNFGKLDIFAKAIRKSVSKLRSGVDLFFLSEIEFIQGKNKKTLTDTIALERFDNLSKMPERFKVASAISKSLENLIKGQEKDPSLFNLLNETFVRLNCLPQSANYLLIYYCFIWNLLSLLGYHCQVKKCTNCQEKLVPYSIYFSSKEGGVICKKCLARDNLAIKINSDIVKILRIILEKDWQTLLKLKIESGSQQILKKVSDNYYSYILSTHSS